MKIIACAAGLEDFLDNQYEPSQEGFFLLVDKISNNSYNNVIILKVDLKLVAVAALALGLGIGSSNVAMADAGKVAVVDVPKIVSESKQVQALKDEQAKKSQELAKWLEVVRADVAKQQTEAGKEKLLKKYEADLAKKREANAKDYAKKLADIDKNISATIEAQAKLKGYDLVLSKSTVLYGGDDLTAEIAKVVK